MNRILVNKGCIRNNIKNLKRYSSTKVTPPLNINNHSVINNYSTSNNNNNSGGIGNENINIINQQQQQKDKTINNNNINYNKLFDHEQFPKQTTTNNSSDGLKSFKVITIDSNGNPYEERIYKSRLSSDLKLQARDLRTIDPSFPPQMPTILAREKVLIISIGCVRAVVQFNRVMLFDTQNTQIREETIQGIRESLTTQTEYLPLPFEFKVFESILDLICKKLEFEFRRMQSLIEKELQMLNDNPEHNLEELLLYHKKGLNQFEVKIKEITDAITDLLQSDEDMALMYLSFRSATGGARKKNQHDEIEILLETYTRQLEQMSSNISQLKETLNSTEEFVNFQLDTARNKMMRMNLMLSLVTISTGLGGVVTGTFGMNLFNGLEQHPNAFLMACTAITCVGTMTFFGLKYYCQVKQILPYTKKTPARLALGLGFRNDSFINPLRDNIILNEQSQHLLKEQQASNNSGNIKSSTTPSSSSTTPQRLNKIQQFQNAQHQFQQQHSNQYIVELQQQIQQQHYQIEKLQQLQYDLITEQQKIIKVSTGISNSIGGGDTTNNDASIIEDDEGDDDDFKKTTTTTTSTNTKHPIQIKKRYQHPTPALSSFWKILNEETTKENNNINFKNIKNNTNNKN